MTTEKQALLAREWGAVLDGAGQAIEWVEQVRGDSRRLDNDADSLLRQLRQMRNKSRDLQQAAATPMAIGFFGVSQAGKSFLISALGADADGQFETDYGGQRVNFISHVNPPGTGKEATGLVTRFTRAAQPAEDPAFPIEVRLMREVDLAKILCNSWFNDFDQNRVEYRLDETRIERVLSRFEGREAGAAQAGVDADDVVSLWDYARVSFERPLHALENGYWQQAMRLAPRLAAHERAELFSLLWGEIPELTRCYADIAASLGRLDYAQTAFLPLQALTSTVDGRLQYGRDSIMSVDVLLRPNEGKRIEARPCVQGRLAAPVSVDLQHLAVLTLELVFPLRDEPREPCVASVDLLDFPGYRGRYTARELSDVPAEGNPVAQLLLRGKVAYLFERYTDTQAMNGLVMCTHEQSDVSDIAKVLERWVDRSQGDSPQARAGRACGLFWAITKFDLRLQRMLGLTDGAQIDESWYGMIHGTMEDRYGGLGFMKAWSTGPSGEVPFNNVYLVRKPGMEISFIRLNGQREEIDPQRRARLDALGRDFVAHPSIRQRVAQPQQAWDAVLVENDGGMSRLAEGLSRIVDIDFKLDRLRQQLQDEREGKTGVLHRLAQYHQSIDGDDLALKKQRGQQLAQALYGARKAIPELMHALELQREDLRDLYLNGLKTPEGEDEAVSPAAEAPVESNPFAAAANAANPFAAAEPNPFAAEPNPFAAEPGPFGAAPASAPAGARQPALKTADHRYAQAVFQRWVAHLRELPQRTHLLASLGIAPELADMLVEELVTAAHRMQLQEQIEARLTQRQDSSSRREQLAMRQVLRAQLALHDFLAWLGFLEIDQAQRPLSLVNKQHLFTATTRLDAAGLPDLDAQPLDTNAQYAGYWLTGLTDVVLNNAGHAAGRDISLEQNQALGRILQGFTQA